MRQIKLSCTSVHASRLAMTIACPCHLASSPRRTAVNICINLILTDWWMGVPICWAYLHSLNANILVTMHISENYWLIKKLFLNTMRYIILRFTYLVTNLITYWDWSYSTWWQRTRRAKWDRLHGLNIRNMVIGMDIHQQVHSKTSITTAGGQKCVISMAARPIDSFFAS